MRLLICIFILILGVQNSYACFSPPKHMYLSHDEAINDAEWIARVRSPSRIDGGVKMKVLEYVKGSGPEFIEFNNASIENAGWHKVSDEANYYGHTVSSFWNFGGSSSMEPDCNIYPGFLSSGQYLVFGPLDYDVGFEQIISDDDSWLKYVRERVKGNLPAKPNEISLSEYLENAKAVVRFEAKWEHNRAVWKETVLKGQRDSYASMLFPSPPAFFDTKLNPTCLSYGRPRELMDTNNGVFDRIYVIEQIPTEKTKAPQHLACAGSDKNGWGEISAFGIFSVTGHDYFDVVGEFVFRQWARYRTQNEKKELNEFLSILE